MDLYIGLDVGGTKIAGGVFHPDGGLLHDLNVPTPNDYDTFIGVCANTISELEKKAGESCPVGIGIPGIVNEWFGTVDAANLPWIKNKSFRSDLSNAIGREVRIANDANCMALAEAVDGAGAGYDTVLGLIVGTGVGAGYICNGKIIGGINGMTGEIGHLPLPFREECDGPLTACYCRQQGCIEKMISGPALGNLYTYMTGKTAAPPVIADLARAGDLDALKVLDRYYEVFSKAMVTFLYSFDPAVIVVSGGMNDLPNLYDEVQKRWGKYTYVDKPKTKLIKAVHGPMAGLRGAAWLWRTVRLSQIVSQQVTTQLDSVRPK